MVWLVLYHPNYTAVYRGDSKHEVNIYIAESLEEKLDSLIELVRSGALDSVCKRFREAYRAKYGTDPGYVDPKYLELTRHPRSAIVIQSAQPALPSQKEAPHCCDDDDCKMCDRGEHEHCPGNCTLGRWR